MTEDQAEKIISLLKEIRDSLSGIQLDTMDISSVKSNTSSAAEYLKKIKDNLR